MKKRVSVLGACGSIGKSSIDILSGAKDDFDVVLLSTHSNYSQLEQLSALWPKARCVLSGTTGGKEKLLDAIKNSGADLTINGICGAAGLEPSMAAVESGSNLALANKETIVMASRIIFRRAKEKNVKIIPVDSEHSAVFRLIEAHGSVDEIILTASGGPFLNKNIEELKKVKVHEALAHPTWKMGKKITIDSANMANKGLEIIEAAALFNMPTEKIKVVIHPQSIVHSMVRLSNGVVYAQLSRPDMRYPIHDALYWPDIKPAKLESLNFDSLTLDFKKPDTEKFPMLGLAYQAAKTQRLYPCAYNAANEAACAAFLDDRIGFTEIAEITKYVLEKDWSNAADTLEAILNCDINARKRANERICSAA
jgi:1-deoxy-D-xylulose-5-phosphate reductoisomerase